MTIKDKTKVQRRVSGRRAHEVGRAKDLLLPPGIKLTSHKSDRIVIKEMDIRGNRSMSFEDVESIATKLCEAIQLEDTGVIKELLLRRIPVEALYTQVSSLRGLRHHTALHYAVEEDGGSRAGMLKMLLRSFPKELQAHIDELGQGQVERRHYGENQDYHRFLEFEEYTPLCWAALHANVEAVKSLLAAGANVDSQESHDQSTALITVCSRSTTENRDREYRVITLLRKSGAKIDLQDSKGCTALHYLLSRGYHDFFRMLLPRTETPLTASNIHGWTLLHCAAFYSRGQDTGELVHSIINKGVDIAFRNKQGLTAMELAKRSSNARVVKILKPYKVPVTDSNSTASNKYDSVKVTPTTSRTTEIYRARGESSGALEISNVDQNLHSTFEKSPGLTKDSTIRAGGQKDQRNLKQQLLRNPKPVFSPDLNDPWQAFYRFSRQSAFLDGKFHESSTIMLTMKLGKNKSDNYPLFFMGPFSTTYHMTLQNATGGWSLEKRGAFQLYGKQYRAAVAAFEECLNFPTEKTEDRERQTFRVSIHLACALSYLYENDHAQRILERLVPPRKCGNNRDILLYTRCLAEYFLYNKDLPRAGLFFEYLFDTSNDLQSPLREAEVWLGLVLSHESLEWKSQSPFRYTFVEDVPFDDPTEKLLFFLVGLVASSKVTDSISIIGLEDAARFEAENASIGSHISNLPYIYLAKTYAASSNYEEALKICQRPSGTLIDEAGIFKTLLLPIYLEIEAECWFDLRKYDESHNRYSELLNLLQNNSGEIVYLIAYVDSHFGSYNTVGTERIGPDIERIKHNLKLLKDKF